MCFKALSVFLQTNEYGSMCFWIISCFDALLDNCQMAVPQKKMKRLSSSPHPHVVSNPMTDFILWKNTKGEV